MVRRLLRKGLFRLLPLLLLLLRLPVEAKTETDAYRFYQQYGSNKMVLLENNLYFCTRSKLQTVPGYTYRTIGFTLTLRTPEGEKRQIQVALGESLSEINGVKRQENGLPISYSLCCLSAETLTTRLRMAYPQENLTAVFAGTQALTLMVDAIMVVRLQGKAFGSIRENDQGTVDVSGTVYQDARGIAGAIDWAPGNDFTTHFNIRLSITLGELYPERLVRHIAAETLYSLPAGSRWNEGEAAALLNRSLARSGEEAERSLSLSAAEVKGLRKELQQRGYGTGSEYRTLLAWLGGGG